MASLAASAALPQNIIIIAGQTEHQLSETDDVHGKSEAQIPIKINDWLATCKYKYLPCITNNDCCSQKCLKSPIQPVGNCA